MLFLSPREKQNKKERVSELRTSRIIILSTKQQQAYCCVRRKRLASPINTRSRPTPTVVHLPGTLPPWSLHQQHVGRKGKPRVKSKGRCIPVHVDTNPLRSHFACPNHLKCTLPSHTLAMRCLLVAKRSCICTERSITPQSPHQVKAHTGIGEIDGR